MLPIYNEIFLWRMSRTTMHSPGNHPILNNGSEEGNPEEALRKSVPSSQNEAQLVLNS